MLAFTTETSNQAKEVFLKFVNGRLASLEHNGIAYGIDSVRLSGYDRVLQRDCPLEQFLTELVLRGHVSVSTLGCVYRYLTIVFDQAVTLDAGVIESQESQHQTRLIRIHYRPHRISNSIG
jgi:hypothetical protein